LSVTYFILVFLHLILISLTLRLIQVFISPHTIELRSIVVPRSNELGQFSFTQYTMQLNYAQLSSLTNQSITFPSSFQEADICHFLRENCGVSTLALRGKCVFQERKRVTRANIDSTHTLKRIHTKKASGKSTDLSINTNLL